MPLFAFGNYDPMSPTPKTTSGTLSVSCGALVLNALVSYEVHFSTGQSGSYTNRYLNNAGTQLPYNLYTDASHTTIMGNGTGSTGRIQDGYLLGLLYAVTRSYPIYGKIPAQVNAGAGAYTDTITVTVLF